MARITGLTSTAVCSARCRAIDFGTISPTTMWTYVMSRTATMLASA